MEKDNAPAIDSNDSKQEHPAFNPAYPAHGTQPARLLAAFIFGAVIDPLKAWRRTGIYRLADTVFQLRGLGWPIETGRLDVHNRFGEACHVAQYRLAAEAIERAGLGAKRFADDEITLMSERRAA